MEKILKILIGIVLAILLFIWLSSTYKSCGKTNTEIETTSQVEASGEEDFDDDFYDPETNIATEKHEDQIGEVVEEPVTDYTEVDEIVEKKEAPRKATPKPKPVVKTPVKKTPSYTTGGRYLIIAGSYLVKDNAYKMVDKLKRLGYSQAEIVQFDNSQHNTVLARRYSDYNDALEASAQLKRKGIDNYVHKKVD